MQALGRRDFRAALDFLAMLGDASDLDDYAARTAFGLDRVIPCLGAAYNEVNFARRRVRWITGIPTRPGDIEAFELHMPDNPIVDYLSRHPNSDAIANSDLISERSWRDLGVYQDVYHPHRLEHILSINAAQPPMMIGIALFREQTPFSERDRALLSLLRPHLANIYRSVAMLTDLGERTALLDRGIEVGGLGAIGLGDDDRIRSTTGAARAWLATYFDHPATADSLPDTIRAWLRRLSLPASGDEMMPDVASALVIDHGGARLKLRLVRHSRQRMILMQEQCTTPRPEHLAALGLAPREAEILTWVAAGKSDAEIGQILSISPRTVSHTLERVYRKLGVETRTAAAMRALSTATAQL